MSKCATVIDYKVWGIIYELIIQKTGITKPLSVQQISNRTLLNDISTYIYISITGL